MKSLPVAGAAVAVAALAFACGSADPETPTITGTVDRRPPEAPPVDQLPAKAMLTVTLEDISRADAPSMVLATQTIELVGETFPAAFQLPYSLGDIAERNTYQVSARVTSGGNLLMISDTITPVITGDAPTTGVEVALIYIADN